jgi:hypothetical protein
MKAPKQLSLAETGFLPRSSKPTWKEIFLSEIDRIEPHYFKAGDKGGRPAMGLSAMLRREFLEDMKS